MPPEVGRAGPLVAGDVVGRPLRDDAAGVEDDDVVGEAPDDPEVVLDDDQREAFAAQFAQELGDARGLGRRGAGGRLVDQQDGRAGRVGGASISTRWSPADSSPAGPSRGSPKRARIVSASATNAASSARCCGVAKSERKKPARLRRPAEATSRCSSGVSDGKTESPAACAPPRRRRRSGRRPGAIVPASMRSTVVLPEPFGPISAVTVRGAAPTETSSAATSAS